LNLEQIDINLFKQKAYIDSYNTIILIKSRLIKAFIRRIIHVKIFIIIFLNFKIMIAVYYANFSEKNFFFEPTNVKLILYAHLIDYIIKGIFIKNDTYYTVKIPRNYRLNNFLKINFDNYYYVFFKAVKFAIK